MKFDRAAYMQPFWTGSTVVNETFLPYDAHEFADGSIEVPLLYKADKILCLQNYELTETFVENKDYFLRDGKLIIPGDSAISHVSAQFLNPAECPNDGLNAKCATGGYLYYTESDALMKMQCAVTYTHSDVWSGYVPKPQPEKLLRTKSRLCGKEPLLLGVFGDSITVGCNCSGMMNMSPYMPVWPELVAQSMTDVYGSPVTVVNRAVGGTTSAWGATCMTDCFKDVKPDLFLINFGMNDGMDVDVQTYIANIKSIIEQAFSLNEEAEIILVSSTFPNPLAMGIQCYRDRYPYLLDLAEQYGARVAVAPMTPVQEYLLQKKRFFDTTASNINHPNDMLCRIYAQIVFETIKL